MLDTIPAAEVSDGETARVSWRRNGITAVLDYAAASHRRAAAALIALALISFLPGFFQIPPIDRDEARFAQATKQMVVSGEYVDIRFQNEVRYKKPVGIYWLQATVVKTARALGVPDALATIWLYRVPSLIGAVGAVLLTYWCALAFVTRRTAILAAIMMAGAVLLGVEARLAKTDAMLLATVVAAMGAMARVYLAERRMPGAPVGWTWPAIFWTALAAGVLLKGPLILMFVVLTAGTLVIADRSARWLLALRPLIGVGWLALLVLPWFIAIVAKSGGAFFAKAVGEDLLAKVVSGRESHGAPPGLYLLLYWITFWPGSILTGFALPAMWKARRQPAAQFLLAWLVPSWIVFELVITKLPHYVLPLYPAIAILLAGAVEVRLLVRQRWLAHGTIGWFLLPCAVSVAMILGFVTVGHELGLVAWPFAAAMMVLGLMAWQFFDVDHAERALLYAMAAAIVIAVGFYAVTVPRLPQLFPAASLARIVAKSNCKQPLAAAAGYHEPSLVFMAGTATRLTDGAGAADFLRQGGCRFAFIEAHQQRAFVQRAEAIQLRYAAGPRIEAINISGGHQINIAVYRSEGAP